MEPLGQDNILPFLADIFARRGSEEYLGESVTIGDHMLQAAHFAAQDGHEDRLVIATLLHDIGHFTGEFVGMPLPEDIIFIEDKINRFHEQAGAVVLALFFPGMITECCRQHVAAKRYLCAREPKYFSQLSAASMHSLRLQGGAMSNEEAEAFENNPYFDAIIALRRYDERSKIAGLKVPGFESYRPLMENLLLTV